MIVTARPLRSGRYTTIKWDRNVSEVFKALRPCCKDLADAWERGWRGSVTSFPLSQALLDEWPCERRLFHRFAIAPLFVRVCVCVAEKRTSASFFFSHVISEAKIIYGCQEVPRSALMPEKTLTRVWWGMEGVERVSHPQNALMYFLCQRATGRSHPKSCCLTNKRISEVAWSTVLRARPQN